MNYYKIKAEDEYDNNINLYVIIDYSIKQRMITLHLKGGGIRTLMYPTGNKAREMYNYFLKLENKKRKRLKKEIKKVNDIDDLCDEHY